MSTFKRLFNVGKGKAKVARKEAAETDWVDVARHKVADAAETVADAIRPPEKDQELEQELAEVRRSAPPPPVDEGGDEPVVQDAEEVARNIENTPKKPKKRTL